MRMTMREAKTKNGVHNRDTRVLNRFGVNKEGGATSPLPPFARQLHRARTPNDAQLRGAGSRTHHNGDRALRPLC